MGQCDDGGQCGSLATALSLLLLCLLLHVQEVRTSTLSPENSQTL